MTNKNEFDYSPKYIYKSLNYHRDKSSHKSQWVINLDDEHKIFQDCYNESYFNSETTKGWNISDEYIGVSILAKQMKHLRLAEFVDKNKVKTWHGYPITTGKKKENIPEYTVLQKWIEQNKLTKIEYKKMARGKEWE